MNAERERRNAEGGNLEVDRPGESGVCSPTVEAREGRPKVEGRRQWIEARGGRQILEGRSRRQEARGKRSEGINSIA